jgi:hypothetical protein
MCADVHAPHGIAFDIKDGAQIGFDAHRVDCLAISSGEFMDFVRAEPCIEWVFLKILKAALAACFCGTESFASARRKDRAARNR